MIVAINYANDPYKKTQKYCTHSAYKYGVDKVFEYGPKDIDIDFDQIDLDDDSTLLLCTDGLSNYVSNEEIIELTKDKKHYAFADRLVNRANENGGGDNITAVVISK